MNENLFSRECMKIRTLDRKERVANEKFEDYLSCGSEVVTWRGIKYSGPSKHSFAYVEWLKEDDRDLDILVQTSPAFNGHAFPKLKLRYKPSLVQSVRGDDMEGMLRDAFNMHNHGLQSFPADFVASDDCNLGGNAFAEQGRSVPHEEPNGEAAKFGSGKNVTDEVK
ncbi:hypothetical protein GOBAR_DD28053 [Gossypium barbadense]|nr:hypothetical protein GOBAR_DD28053 [Gossypium barbadense]